MLVNLGNYLIHGSPPRVWGQPTLIKMDGVVGRFTPTRVGTTFNDVID